MNLHNIKEELSKSTTVNYYQVLYNSLNRNYISEIDNPNYKEMHHISNKNKGIHKETYNIETLTC